MDELTASVGRQRIMPNTDGNEGSGHRVRVLVR